MSNYKLLLADDSVTIQKVVNLTFADEGIEVITVGDGNAALERLAEMTPDLVLADVNMPGANGYEICARIKGNEATRDVPVMLLVGSFEPFDEEEAARVGADDYLTKPFQSIRQLVNKVTDLLHRGEAPVEETEEAPVAEEEHYENAAVSEEIGEESGHIPEQVAEAPDEAIPFAETLRMDVPAEIEAPAGEQEEAEPAEPVVFGDAGLDDEMIETSRVSDSTEEPVETPGEEDSSWRREEVDETEEKGFATVGSGERFPFAESFGESSADEAAGDVEPSAEIPVNIDERSDFLELPPLVQETGIMAFDGARSEPSPAPAEPTPVSPELIETIARRVAEKLAERLIRSVDDLVPEITDEVVKQLWEEGLIK